MKASAGPQLKPEDILITRQANTHKCEQMSHNMLDHCDIHTM